jgi:putative transposase
MDNDGGSAGLKRQSKAEIFLHLVWATRLREPRITGEWERTVHRCIEAEARRLGCVVLALNGMPDHLHLLVEIPTKLSAAELAQQVKGVSSRLLNEQLPLHDAFRWQEAYGAFSVSRSHLKRVIAYVETQKEHHQAGSVWAEWEETEYQPSARPPGRLAEGSTAGQFSARTPRGSP